MNTEKQKIEDEILKIFSQIIPKLSEKGKERLLGIGEGMAIKLEKEKENSNKKGA